MRSIHKKHIKSRLIITTIISLILITTIFLFDDVNHRSCLGNPAVLTFLVIGAPLLGFLILLDIIYLVIIKQVSTFKVLLNILIAITSLVISSITIGLFTN